MLQAHQQPVGVFADNFVTQSIVKYHLANQVLTGNDDRCLKLQIWTALGRVAGQDGLQDPITALEHPRADNGSLPRASTDRHHLHGSGH